MVYHPHFAPITSSLSRSYVIPALFLNPILFLHSINAILSRILAPIVIHNVAMQPPPYTTRGPSARHPHLDIHASDQLCWSYTLVMVGVQLIAFSGVQKRRERWKEGNKSKKEADKLKRSQDIGWGMDGAVNDAHLNIDDVASSRSNELDNPSSRCQNGSSRTGRKNSDNHFNSDDEDNTSEESEVIL